MQFSAYYDSSRRSGRSRRFRVTPDSGERNLSLEERGSDLGGWLAGPEEVPPVSVAKLSIYYVLFVFSRKKCCKTFVDVLKKVFLLLTVIASADVYPCCALFYYVFCTF